MASELSAQWCEEHPWKNKVACPLKATGKQGTVGGSEEWGKSAQRLDVMGKLDFSVHITVHNTLWDCIRILGEGKGGFDTDAKFVGSHPMSFQPDLF